MGRVSGIVISAILRSGHAQKLYVAISPGATLVMSPLNLGDLTTVFSMSVLYETLSWTVRVLITLGLRSAP